MFPDVTTLQSFYASPLGKAVATQLQNAIQSALPSQKECTLLGLGYPFPYLKKSKCLTYVACPAPMGVLPWPLRKKGSKQASRSVLTWPEQLPFADNTFDAILLAHCLEFSGDTQAVLAECCRVLRPEGRIIALVPNRHGLWCRREVSPLARGQPFSGVYFKELLIGECFQEITLKNALFAPPIAQPWVLKLADHCEKFGQTLHLPMGGMVVATAVKRISTGTPVRAKRGMLRHLPVVGMPEPTNFKGSN